VPFSIIAPTTTQVPPVVFMRNQVVCALLYLCDE
jgi:hypothetical protein